MFELFAACAVAACRPETAAASGEVILARASSPSAAHVRRVARGCGIEGAYVVRRTRRTHDVVAPAADASGRATRCTERWIRDNWQSLDLRPILYAGGRARMP